MISGCSRRRCPRLTVVRQKAAANDRGYNKLALGAFVRGLGDLARLGFSAFPQRRFARKLDAALVVDADAFYPDHVANVCNIFGAFHPEVRQLGNVHEPVPAWEYFD